MPSVQEAAAQSGRQRSTCSCVSKRSMQAPSGGGGGGKQGKYDADRTYEDGSLLFTAESLGAVSFEELKP
jgi:hypothetical protein